MPDESNPHPIFRFVQLRKPTANAAGVHLIGTKFAIALAAERVPAMRAATANRFLQERGSRGTSLAAFPNATAVKELLTELAASEDAMVREVFRRVGRARVASDAFVEDRDNISDLILAAKFATEPLAWDLAMYQRIYRVMFLLHEHHREPASLE